jgi:gluconate 2-dehydrogenase gamma chain
MTSRRSALVVLATAPVLASAAGRSDEHEHAAEHSPPSALPKKPGYFSATDFGLLARLTDLIIPRTDTPGASDSGVPLRIDRLTAQNSAYQSAFRQGFDYLNLQAKPGGKSFVELTNAEQVSILNGMSLSADSPQGQFFKLVKNLTIEGYYATQEGLVQELGFKGNTFRKSFEGCTHPEHQV